MGLLPSGSGYFNQRTYQWEPALETVVFQAEMRQGNNDEGETTSAHQLAQQMDGALPVLRVQVRV